MDGTECKVGGEVVIIDGGQPAVITEVLTVVRLRLPNGMNSGFYYRPEELTPYVRPLAVGDRVRCNRDPYYVGKIVYRNEKEACVEDDRGDLWCPPIHILERIPEEAGK